MDEDDDIIRLQALYRSAAHETPSVAMDNAILGAAANKVRRDRVVPYMALAAGLLVAVLIARDINMPTPGAAPDQTRDYLLALHTPAAGDTAMTAPESQQ